MSASGKLIDGNKTYLKKWLMEYLYQRQEIITSKYMEKGNEYEDEAIIKLACYLDMPLVKNTERRSNDFLTGECDVDAGQFILDVKNSWSFATFPLLETECPNKDYYWQAQGYMELWGVQKYKLAYVLQSLKEGKLLDNEIFYYAKNNNLDINEAREYITDYYNYDDLPDDLTIKVFDIEYNEEDVKKVKEKVDICREYLNELYSSVIKF